MSDSMTASERLIENETEAIECLGSNKPTSGYVMLQESIDMAIKALEKQIPKKPVHDGCFDSEGIWHEWKGVNGRPYDLCPNCNTNLCCEMPYDNKPKYCKHCGQRLDFKEV